MRACVCVHVCVCCVQLHELCEFSLACSCAGFQTFCTFSLPEHVCASGAVNLQYVTWRFLSGPYVYVFVDYSLFQLARRSLVFTILSLVFTVLSLVFTILSQSAVTTYSRRHYSLAAIAICSRLHCSLSC